MCRRLLQLAGWLLFLASAGCGGKTVEVSGRLTWDGEALHGSKDRPLRVSFSPVVRGQVRHDLQIRPRVDQNAGTFTFAEPIPAGLYQISVRQFDEAGIDRFQGDYFEGNTPLLFDLSENRELVIDLAHPGQGTP